MNRNLAAECRRVQTDNNGTPESELALTTCLEGPLVTYTGKLSMAPTFKDTFKMIHRIFKPLPHQFSSPFMWAVECIGLLRKGV